MIHKALKNAMTIPQLSVCHIVPRPLPSPSFRQFARAIIRKKQRQRPSVQTEGISIMHKRVGGWKTRRTRHIIPAAASSTSQESKNNKSIQNKTETTANKHTKPPNSPTSVYTSRAHWLEVIKQQQILSEAKTRSRIHIRCIRAYLHTNEMKHKQLVMDGRHVRHCHCRTNRLTINGASKQPPRQDNAAHHLRDPNQAVMLASVIQAAGKQPRTDTPV